jgi:hypothetical protein
MSRAALDDEALRRAIATRAREAGAWTVRLEFAKTTQGKPTETTP